jgi:hypothetical protein
VRSLLVAFAILCVFGGAGTAQAQKAERVVALQNPPRGNTAGGCAWSSFQAMRLNLRYLGEDADWDWLLGVSGEAFWMAWTPRWTETLSCVIQTDSLANAARAYGYEYQWRTGDTVSEAFTTLKRRIDRGMPTMVAGLTNGGPDTWSLVVGYAAADPKAPPVKNWPADKALNPTDRPDLNLLLNVHIAAGPTWEALPGEAAAPADWRGRIRQCLFTDPRRASLETAPMFLLVRKGTPPSRAEAARDAVRLAVAMARQRPVRMSEGWDGDRYSFGLEALRGWASSLRQMAYPEDWEKWRQEPGPHDVSDPALRMGVFHDMAERRKGAARFLRMAEAYLPLQRERLAEAANLYEGEAEAATQLAQLFAGPSGEPLSPEQSQAAMKDPETRQKGAQLLEDMAAAERAAVLQLEAAAPQEP